ncbi:hypothetical protein [Streptomyces sp. NPDC047706]|uniref:hypothetical protein n=1 Tax=Streptomyces sp. NPDC047706 TaxID=3365486 RepID=UPI003719B2EF
MTFGLVQYFIGSRHLAGRKRATECALPPRATRRAVRPVTTGPALAVALAVPVGAYDSPTRGLVVALLPLVSIATCVVLGGLPTLVMALPPTGPRLRRTTLPVR